MKSEKYDSTDIEHILRELAESDRCHMNDELTERCLAIIDDEIERCSRRSIYKKLSQCAAALAIIAIGISFFLQEPTMEVATITEKPSKIEQSQPIIQREKRTMLSQLDCSIEAGFSPIPQKTYTGKDKQIYGVGIYGKYKYTVCADTL